MNKYDLNRDNQTYYGKFKKMYNHIIEELVHANLMVELPDAQWMNGNSHTIEQLNALGCKVTHKITRPEWYIVADEVGSDLSMKGDGRRGGQKFMCGRGSKPYHKSSKKIKHFTCLGFNPSNGRTTDVCDNFFWENPKNRS